MPFRLFLLSAFAFAISLKAARAEEYICGNNRSDPDAAIQDCTRLIDSGTLTGRSLARAYYSRGTTFSLYKNDWDADLADQNKAIIADPSYDDPYVGRAAIYRKRQQLDLALTDVETALRLSPQNFWARMARGGIYIARGEPERGLAELRELGEHGSDITQRQVAYGFQASFLEKMGRIQEAISARRSSNALRQNDYDVEQIKRLGGQP